MGTAGEAARFGKAAKRGRDLEGGRIPGFLFLLTGAGMGKHSLLSVLVTSLSTGNLPELCAGGAGYGGRLENRVDT